MSSPEAILADFVAGFPVEDIPPSAMRHAKLLLVDAIGCALAGDLAAETPAIRATAARVFGGGDITVVNSDETLSEAAAALVNAYLITAMTVCDVYRPAHCHMTPLIVPPALAATESTPTSGTAFLAALVIGMETTTRIALGLDYPTFRRRGWHSPGVVGPLGAAAVVGRIAGFDATTLNNALGLAATQSAGSYLSWGTPAVKFHQARGASSGVLAARLAEAGFKGGQLPLTAPDGGIYHTHTDGGDPDVVVADLGSRWEMEQIAVRLWPGASPVQAMLTAVFDLIESEAADAQSVATVRIRISPEDFETHGGFGRPEGTFEALLSYAYLCSVALTDGGVWFEQVDASRLSDSQLKKFGQERIAVMPGDDIPVNGCEMEMEFTDGRRRTRRVEAARGTPQNPADEKDVAAKFHRAADPRLGRSRAESLLHLLMNVEDLEDVRQISGHLKASV